MTAHIAKVTYRRSFDIVMIGTDRFDVTVTAQNGGQSTYNGLTFDETVDYYTKWSCYKDWVRP